MALPLQRAWVQFLVRELRFQNWMAKRKKKIQMNLFTKEKQTHRHRKQTYGYQRENADRD